MKQYRIEHICTIKSSRRIFANQYSTKGVPFFRGKEITQLSIGNTVENPLYISEKSFSDIMRNGTPQIDDILITAVGTIGSVWKVNIDTPFYFKDGNIIWLSNIDKNIVIPTFLKYYLQSKTFQHRIEEISIGSTQKALTIDAIKKEVVILPCIETQQHIVDILGSIDYSIENNQSIMAKLIELGKRILQKAYSEQRYKKKRLGDCLCLLKDGTHNPPARVENGIPLITGQTIDNGFIVYDKMTYIKESDYKKIHNRYAPSNNDLIITKIGTLGKVAILRKQDIPIALHCNSALLRFTEMSPAVAFFVLNSDEFQNEFHQKKNRTVQEFINLEQIGNLELLYPELNNDEQNLLIDLLDRISLIEEENKKKAELKHLYLKEFFG